MREKIWFNKGVQNGILVKGIYNEIYTSKYHKHTANSFYPHCGFAILIPIQIFLNFIGKHASTNYNRTMPQSKKEKQ